MSLTPRQRQQLYSVFKLIKGKMPSENTEARLANRAGLPSKLVALALQILHNEGEGWIDFDQPRRSSIRGYFVKEGYEKKTEANLSTLFAEWQAVDHAPIGGLQFDHDPDDPDDVWEEGTYEDD